VNKKRLRSLLRPHRLTLLVLTAIAASLAATTNATPAPAPVSKAHPVIDPGWIYAENWFDSTNFIYKVAGADGCLPGATSASCSDATQGDASHNLPENYNGAQEFYSWWKGLGTTSTPQPNGPLGKFMSSRDHYFPTRIWQLNDAELTIPGATCAGQQVMLASHNDSTPVTAVSPGTSLTPMTGMHSGNWGNGSGYDANMGELMNLEEIGSVLRWHQANGTYPARTIKATLYDNEEGGLVGSADYSAAGTPATLLQEPTAAGATQINVGSVTNLGVGTQIAIDETDGNTENAVVQTAGGNPRGATSLAAASAIGDTNIKVVGQSTTSSAATAVGATNIKFASATNILANTQLTIGTGASAETVTITNVGTTGSGGTGLTVTPALAIAHASGSAILTSGAFVVGEHVRIDTFGDPNQEWDVVQSIGSAGATGTGITLATALTKAHASGAPVQDLNAPITLSAPLSHAHAAGTTVNGPATGLLSDSPQGQIIGVLNNDQDGLNYPAHKWGTGYYMSNLLDGQAGPWFNNINATPVSPAPNSVYGTVGIQRLQHNLPAVQAFRQSAANAVTQALQDLGQKYNFSIPLEGPLQFKNTGSIPDNPGIQSVPAYLPQDQAQYTPVLDDRTGRTDQVSFGVRGIPSLGDIGQYDSSTDPLVGGNDNPYPAAYPSKPVLRGEFGQDSTSDYFSNLNFWASGTVHGPNGFDSPSEGLVRGVEFIATWFSYVIASPEEGGAVAKPHRPIAYFEMTPKKPTAQTTVTFDAGFSRKDDGKANGLTYYWDFGDGSPLTATTDPLIQHTFPTQAAWRDVKLLVGDGHDHWGSFRQLEPIDFFPTYYPAVAPATEPLPPSSGPAADPCGTLAPDEQAAMIAATATAGTSAAPTVTLSDTASWALKPH
jgi:PKD domain